MNSLGTELRTSELARLLPIAWPIFFKNRRPWEAQAMVMPHIVHGESVLLATPTATGKTEAAIAPLFQRHISFRRSSVSTIYIAPTKALVNDLYTRLFEYLGIRFPNSIQRYTGDRHDFRSAKDAFCLLVTPEALDSLQLTQPDVLSTIRAIVIDEIHLLHGSARGQQLRYVIDRIRKASETSKYHQKDYFQIVGMTATIDQIEDVRITWLGEDSISLSNGTPRKIEIKMIDLISGEDKDYQYSRAVALRQWCERNEVSKALIFANSRNSAHSFAAALAKEMSGTRWPVHLHIGILSGAERERIEHAMRNEQFGICVATSTLEIGIDIGDVEVIVLLDPPNSVSSFLQRIGRGNRRSDKCRVIVFRENMENESQFAALLDCAQRGALDDIHEFDRPSVRFQQVLSLTWWAVRNGQALTRSAIKRWSGYHSHSDVIDDMLETGVLKNVRGALIPSDEWMDIGDKRRIHSVIVGGCGLPVVDMFSGEIVAAWGQNNNMSGSVYFAGNLKRLQSSVDGQKYLEGERGESGKLAKLPTSRNRNGVSRTIIWGMARQRGFDPESWLFYNDILITWGGILYNKLLLTILEYNNIVKKCTADALSVKGIDKPENIILSKIHELALVSLTNRNLPRKMTRGFLVKTAFFSSLSPKIQSIEEQNSVPFPGFLKWIDECKGIKLVSESPNLL